MPKVDREKVVEYARSHPDSSFAEIASAAGCSTGYACLLCRDVFGPRGRGKKTGRHDEIDDKLIEVFSENPGTRYKDAAEKLGMSYSYVYRRARELGLRKYRSHDVLREEIRQYVRTHPGAQVIDVVAAFRCSGVIASAVMRDMGVRQQRAKCGEKLTSFLEEHPGISARQAAKEFGCSLSAVYDALGGRQAKDKRSPYSPRNPVSWDGVSALLEENPRMTITEISRRLGASLSQISILLRRHGIRDRQKIKIDPEVFRKALVANPTMSYAELGRLFGCSRQAAAEMAKRMGLANERYEKVQFADDEIIRAILDNPNKSLKEIGEILGVPDYIVRHRAMRHGLSRREKKKKEILLAQKYAEAHPTERICDIADRFGVSESMISDYLEDKGLREKWHRRVDDSELAKMIDDNPEMTRRELAEHFGCTVHAISKAKARLARVDEKPKERKPQSSVPWDEIEVALRENEDASIRELSEKVGLSTSALQRQLRKHGCLRGHKKKIDIEEMRQMLDSGASLESTANRFGVSISAVKAARDRIERKEGREKVDRRREKKSRNQGVGGRA